MDKLQAYRDKRDAARTPEPVPPPGASPPDAALGGTFVIQEHHARRLHWDFRLERDGVLVSWALPKGVPYDPAVNHLAVHTEDHPLEYGRFEGQIPRGEYGAGEVTIWDHGTYETLKWAPSEVKVLLYGQRVTGGYVLFQTKGNQWMIHRERLALPGPLRPMLAVTAPAPRDLDHWALEMKWDGVRALAYIERGQVRLMSRTERDITVTYPELARLGTATLPEQLTSAAPAAHKQMLLDGEIVVFGAGRGQHGPQGAGQGQPLPVDHPLIALGLEQHVTAGDPLPVQQDLHLAGRPFQRLVGAVVPDGDRAGTVLAAGDLPLEAAVLQRMVFGVHGQVVDCRIGRDALGQGPGHEHPAAFEPEIPVQPPGVMLLDHERPARRGVRR